MAAHPTQGAAPVGKLFRGREPFGSPPGHASRMTGVDAARGVAMILVCLSHVRMYLVDSAPVLHDILTYTTRLATPTFLLLSGFVAAYVLSSARTNARLSLFDRGLFVLLAGHLLLNLADLQDVPLEQWLFGRVTVTDAIAVCLMSAALLWRLPAKWLAALGALLAIATWPIAMLWSPESMGAQYAGAVLFNVRSHATALTDAAIVPYLGVFLLGMSLSKWSSPLLTRKAFAQVAQRLAWIAVIAIACVFVGVGVWYSIKGLVLERVLDPEVQAAVRRAMDPRSKLPPSLGYLMLYGGGGLLMAAACLYGRPRALLEPLTQWAAVLGRASLMCFVVQDWLLVLAPAALGFDDLQSVVFWSVYFAAVVIALHWLASRWDAARANRFLTLGLKRLA